MARKQKSKAERVFVNTSLFVVIDKEGNVWKNENESIKPTEITPDFFLTGNQAKDLKDQLGLNFMYNQVGLSIYNQAV